MTYLNLEFIYQIHQSTKQQLNNKSTKNNLNKLNRSKDYKNSLQEQNSFFITITL